MGCAQCQCDSDAGAQVHAVVAALRDDDFDGAIALGLLEASNTCPGCNEACRAALASARRQREVALAARERHRSRNLRQQRRQDERAERRKPPATTTNTAIPALPPAAAAALARAKARAATRAPR